MSPHANITLAYIIIMVIYFIRMMYHDNIVKNDGHYDKVDYHKFNRLIYGVSFITCGFLVWNYSKL